MNVQKVAGRIEGKNILESLKELIELYPGKVVFTTSFGIEDQVISDIIFKNNLPVRVVTLDTGRLFEQTYKVWSNTLKIYGKTINAFAPDKNDIENLLNKKGPFSFYQSVENRKECCHIRKVIPLDRALKGIECWITGIRAEHSPGRAGMNKVETDRARGIIKYHPLFEWSQKEVEDYIKENKVPYNELHDKGFVSVGCAPCTRDIKEGEDYKSGRWWWENVNGKECGMHS